MAMPIDIEALQLHRLLRKKSIDMAVTACKVLLFLITAIFVLLIIQSAVSAFLDSRAAITQLDKDVNLLLAKEGEKVKINNASRSYSVISTNKIFGDFTGQNASQVPVAPKVEAPLSLELIGTFVASGQAPYAIIEDKKKKVQDVFMLKDMVFDQAKLMLISSDRVEVERNGQREVLKLDDTPDESVEMKEGVALIGDNQYVVDEGELDKALGNLGLLLTQARAVPYFKEGKAVGLRLFAIRSASIFEKIGMKNGDILKSINGNSLADLSQAMKLFEKLKEERTLSLTLERNNEEKEFHYQIK